MSGTRSLLLLFLCLFVFSCKQELVIKYANGNLDDAFNEAQLSHKKLFVIAFMTGCRACEDQFFKPILADKELHRALAEDFLLYKCSISDTANNYLAKAAYSVASPSFYLFENNLLKEVVLGTKNLRSVMRAILINKENYSKNKAYHIGLHGNEYIGFVQELITASKAVKGKPLDKSSVANELKLIEANIAKKPFFYNYYLAHKLSLMNKNDSLAAVYAKNALGYNDAFTAYLYKQEIEEVNK